MDSHMVHMMVHSQDIYKNPTYCSLGALYGFTPGTYDDAELGSLEGQTEVTPGGNFEVLLLGA